MTDAEFKLVEAALRSALGRETCYVACYNAANERLSGAPVSTVVEFLRERLQCADPRESADNW